MDLPIPDTPTIHDLLVIGAGLSGLTAAYQLHRHNHTPLVLEARDRPGGRALTLHLQSAALDFGPSWIWPGQPAVAALLTHFRLGTFPQHSSGDLVHHSASGVVRRNPYLKPMANARRIEAGVGALVDAMYKELPEGVVRIGTAVRSLRLEGDYVTVVGRVEGEGGKGKCREVKFAAKRVVFAMPPRLVAGLRFEPALPGRVVRGWEGTPTWMASHAKFHAVYQRAFWREGGLSGDAFSEKGPLGEIHDASGGGEGGPFALFGFFRVDARARKKMGERELVRRSVLQLGEVFGAAARQPLEARVVDWSRDRWTATEADQRMLDYHPEYGRRVGDLGAWKGRLEFIGAEMDAGSGGLIEGAVRQGAEFANGVLRKKGIEMLDSPRFW